MSATPPITQRDVAQACGLHPSTVCLALKNSPSIPEATRRRIQAVAEELGYSPNVAARNLALLRSERNHAANLPLAWINQETRRDHWRADPEARAYFDAARRRAEEAGYHLEEFWTREAGMTAGRIVQILRARGIEGVLFPAHRSFDFSLLNRTWNDFSMVGLGDQRLGEWIDVVCADHHRNTELALQRLTQLGFCNPGLVLTPQADAATCHLLRSSYLRHQADAPGAFRTPVCFCASAGNAAATVSGWCSEHRPDVILYQDPAVMQSARRATGDAVWVSLAAALQPGDAGIEVCAAEVAGAAVDCLVEKVRRFEKGFRESTRLHTIKGVWQEGNLAVRELESVVA
jgi:DNA-binding LacI/PurR family transcriptional regulator